MRVRSGRKSEAEGEEEKEQLRTDKMRGPSDSVLGIAGIVGGGVEKPDL